MPRQKRIDAPGTVHHVMARGIDDLEIFLDDRDRVSFTRRVEEALEETSCLCYAWALMPNHFHMIVRTGARPLGDLMRRVCTGHAVFYNKRHQRRGYLFQDRYKSIPVKSDAYLLEVVRYIHLNPLRGGIVRTMEELDRYRWTGHAAVCGIIPRPWQAIGDVLAFFAPERSKAIRTYRNFVRDGISIGEMSVTDGSTAFFGERTERTRGLMTAILEPVDEPNPRGREVRRDGWTLEHLVERTCEVLHLLPEDVCRKSRERRISMARAAICFLAYSELGISGKRISDFLGITASAVSQAVKRGERFVRENGLNVLG